MFFPQNKLKKTIENPSAQDGPTLSLSHLLPFYLFGAQRLRRSQANVERLAPQPAVSPFGGRVGGGGSGTSWRSLGGRGIGDGRRDDARLHRGGGGRRQGRGLRLAHVAKTDGALRAEQLENQLGQLASSGRNGAFFWHSHTSCLYLEGLAKPLQGRGLDRRQEVSERRHPGHELAALCAGLLQEKQNVHRVKRLVRNNPKARLSHCWASPH